MEVAGDVERSLKIRAYDQLTQRLAQDADDARDRRAWDRAARGYRIYLRLRPGDHDRRIQYGHALKEIGRFDEAATAYGRVLRARPTADLLLQLGHLAKLRGRFDEARTHYAAALALDPLVDAPRDEFDAPPVAPPGEGTPQSPTPRRLGDRHRDRKDWKAAAEAYSEHLKAKSGDWSIWEQLAHTQREMGDLPAAADSYARAAALAPDELEPVLHLAHTLKMLGRLGEAVDCFLRLLRRRPDDPESYRELAGLGEREQALAVIAQSFPPGWVKPAPAGAGAGGVELAVVTIVSNNYLPAAKVLMDSVEAAYPEADRFVCLADHGADARAPLPGNAEILLAHEIGVPGFEGFAFRYGPTELHTALKPFAIDYLLRNRGYRNVIYFDPDIRVYARSQGVLDKLKAGASAVVTPHFRKLQAVRREPNTTAILRCGTFNLGFFAVSACDETLALVDWWRARLLFDCVRDIENGLFVDQKFMDLLPAYAPNYAVEPSPGANLAYWNLLEGELVRRDGGLFFDGAPLEFFHFSGFDPRKPDILSKYLVKGAFDPDSVLAEVLADYAKALAAHDYARVIEIPLSYGRLRDGRLIPPVLRQFFRDVYPGWAGHPFEDFEAEALRPTRPDGADVSAPRIVAYLKDQADWFPHLTGSPAEQAKQVADWLRGARMESADDRAFLGWLAGRVAAWDEGIDHGAPARGPAHAARPHAYGATVFGFLRAESGVGEAGRRIVHALAETGLPTAAKSLSTGTYLERETAADPFIVHQSAYRYHLFAINADNTARLPHLVNDRDWIDRYKIGIWNWELSKFPEAFNGAFEFVDEVWTPSAFITEAVAAATDKPVITIPYAVPIETPDPRLDRAYFGLDPSALVVLAMMDFNSYRDRKNPSGALDAFLAAFGGSDKVQLAIKFHGGDAGDRAAVQARVGELANVVMIDRVLDRAEIVGLQQACDVYLSLHRSEGFGFNIAECMGQGKLVIATDYSGSRQFLDESCGAPVDYTLISVGEGQYPYGTGQHWADPDLDQAAALLRRALDEPNWRAALGARARSRVARDLNPRTVGYLMRARIDEIEFRSGGR